MRLTLSIMLLAINLVCASSLGYKQFLETPQKYPFTHHSDCAYQTLKSIDSTCTLTKNELTYSPINKPKDLQSQFAKLDSIGVRAMEDSVAIFFKPDSAWNAFIKKHLSKAKIQVASIYSLTGTAYPHWLEFYSGLNRWVCVIYPDGLRFDLAKPYSARIVDSEGNPIQLHTLTFKQDQHHAEVYHQLQALLLSQGIKTHQNNPYEISY